MEERLQTRISDEQRDQLIGRINELHANGILRIRDWIGIYNLLLEACQRDKAEALEAYLSEALKDEGEGDA